MTEFKYVGSELDLFAAARNWKAYWASQVKPFIRGDVAEVGAGIGSNTPTLDDGGGGRWVCLEPDPALLSELAKKLASEPGRRPCETVCGTLQSLAGQQFDTIVYIDVLEHIENDGAELAEADAHLRPGGHLIVLSPAHQVLYSPFDAAIGHFRRYSRSSLQAVSPAGLIPVRVRYLDSVGFFASLANSLFLRQSMPKKSQLQVWDNWMVPVSRILDKVLGYSAGKTVIGIWRKPT
jgi:SAM-dependent methyltransferase